jgi:hypothetical protein
VAEQEERQMPYFLPMPQLGKITCMKPEPWTLNAVRNRWSAALDELEVAEEPVTIMRLDEPFIAGVSPTQYTGHLALIAEYDALTGQDRLLPAPVNFPPAGTPTMTDAEALHAMTPWIDRLRLDADALVPARIVTDSRYALKAWQPVNRAVRRRRLHVTVRRYGRDTAVFVPLGFLDAVRTIARRLSEARKEPPARP